MSATRGQGQPFRPNPGQVRATALLEGPQRHTLIAGGSRSGKTFLLVRALVTRAIRAPASRHAILRYRGNAARAAIALDTLPAVMRACYPQVPLVEHRQDSFFELPNGSQIWIGGLDDKDRVEKILGTEFATLYLNECSEIPYSSVLVARTRLAQRLEGLRQRAYYDLNPGGVSHWTNLEFGEHRDPVSRHPLPDPENYQRTFLNPIDNAANLSADYLQSLKNLPEKQRRRFYDGHYVSEIAGALWTFELLERCRLPVSEPRPALRRIVVAVDPSGASGKENVRSDEIGIVVAGKGVDGRAYMLEDCTLRDAPAVWARAAVNAFHKWGADTIVAETNYGGAMVQSTILAADRRVPVKIVSAARGKHVRAEPIATLYERGLVRHVGRLSELEDQLVNFSASGYVGSRSPDRADAAIWAISELMLVEETRVRILGR